MLVFQANRFNGDLVVPLTHVGVWIIPVRILVGRCHVDNGMTIGAGCFQQALHSRNYLVVHFLHIARKWITWSGPGVCQIYANDGRPFSKADAALKPALLIDFAAFVECLLQHFIQIFNGHFLLAPLPGFCCLTGNLRVMDHSADHFHYRSRKNTLRE